MRLQDGTYTHDDLTWLKHEFVEQSYELRKNSGYTEAHNYAQTHFNGCPSEINILTWNLEDKPWNINNLDKK